MASVFVNATTFLLMVILVMVILIIIIHMMDLSDSSSLGVNTTFINNKFN
jgi:hypothetical protein